MSDADLRKVSNDLKGKSDENLAAFRAGKPDNSIYAILADKEFERRERVKQHELDRKLITEDEILSRSWRLINACRCCNRRYRRNFANDVASTAIKRSTIRTASSRISPV